MIFKENFLKKLNKNQIEELLNILYFLEDFECYENQKTSKTIDFLQDLL